VDVDDARHEGQAARIDDPPRIFFGAFDEPPVLHGDVAGESGAPGAVDHARAANQKIQHARSLRHNWRGVQ
jgi:hypothetical protein